MLVFLYFYFPSSFVFFVVSICDRKSGKTKTKNEKKIPNDSRQLVRGCARAKNEKITGVRPKVPHQYIYTFYEFFHWSLDNGYWAKSIVLVKFVIVIWFRYCLCIIYHIKL